MIGPQGQSTLIGRIERVLVSGAEGPQENGDAFLSDVSWDITIFIEGQSVLVEGVKTFYPAPNRTDYNIDASQAVYSGTLVPVIQNGDRLEPMIPVYPATQDCDGPAPITEAINTARRTGSTLSLDARIIQTVQRYLASQQQ